MPRESMVGHGSPWEVEMRYGYDQAGILRVETIGGHGRWRNEEGALFDKVETMVGHRRWRL
jgi:hypothetical protein